MTRIARIGYHQFLFALVHASLLMIRPVTAFLVELHSIADSDGPSPTKPGGPFIRLTAALENHSDEHLSQKSTSEHAGAFHPLKQRIQDFHPNTASDVCRVFHGRGGVFSGCEHITLDWFPPVFLLTSYNQELTTLELAEIQTEVENCCISYFATVEEDARATEIDSGDSVNLVYQFRSATNATSRILQGTLPKPHIVTENGMKFLVRLDRSKNPGIFLDMANGRQWMKQSALGKRVLNLFAYTCGFSIAALLGGAEAVVNVDMVDGTLKTGQKNHELNNLQGARFLAHDIFKSWGKIRKLGPYDIIVADPPSYQKNSFVAKQDYRKVVRRIPDLLMEGGEVLLCLNAPELDTPWLESIVREEAPSLLLVERLANPASFPAADVERSLKVLRYRGTTSLSKDGADMST